MAIIIIIIIIWTWYRSLGGAGGGGSLPALAFVIQWPFLCNVFSLHSLIPLLPHTHPYRQSRSPPSSGGPYTCVYTCYNMCICPSNGGVRIEFARVRKALSRAFYNCCYYHLIKILRTLFLRLFDTHTRTRENTCTHTRVCVCSKTFWVEERTARG